MQFVCLPSVHVNSKPIYRSSEVKSIGQPKHSGDAWLRYILKMSSQVWSPRHNLIKLTFVLRRTHFFPILLLVLDIEQWISTFENPALLDLITLKFEIYFQYLCSFENMPIFRNYPRLIFA